MAVAFAQSMRALAADRSRWSLPSLLLVGALLGGWGVWFVCARVAIYEISQTARLEVDQAVHPIATSGAGRVTVTHLVVGRAVQAGEVLAELDAEAPRLQYEEARVRLTALTAQRQARRQELSAEQVAQQDERQAARVALDEARARYREAEVAARAAAEQADIFVRLGARELVSRLELLRTKADADQKQAAADVLRLAISRLDRDQRTKASDRTARITQFSREVTQLDGDIHTAEATLARLVHTIDQTRVRAPITGYLGEVATLQPGAVVRQGDTLGVVLPPGALQVVASFLPAMALGRVQLGQPARLRLDGFPWAQYGSLTGTVTSVATEARDGVIRVELRLEPAMPTAIPLQHGLPGTVEVEVERISPVTLVLRAVGHHLGMPAQNAAAPGRQDEAS
jgi:multidrug resistance efflux pump